MKIEFGGKEIAATVLEDRGPVGIGGRRLLRIRLEIQDTSEPIEMEVPADEVKLAA